MKNYNTEEIEEMINSGENVVIDFNAPWCQPCKSFAPIFESTSENEEFEGKLKFVKVDVDEQAELSVKYGIRSIPTIIFFKEGKIKEKKIGALTKSGFESFINDNLA